MPIGEPRPLNGYYPHGVYPYWPYQPTTPIYPTTQTWTTNTPVRQHRVRVTQASDGSWRWRCTFPCFHRDHGYNTHDDALRDACTHLRRMAPRYTVWNTAGANSNTFEYRLS